MLAATHLSDSDVSTIFLVLGILILAGAAYCAYLERIAACVLLIVVGLVILLVAA